MMKTETSQWRVSVESNGGFAAARRTFTRIYYDNRMVFSVQDSGRSESEARARVAKWEKSGYVPQETEKVYADYGSARAGGNAFLTRQRAIDKEKARERRSA